MQLSQNALSRRLLQLMLKKKSNLAVAADVATAEEMLQIAEQARGHPILLCWSCSTLAPEGATNQFAVSALLKLSVARCRVSSASGSCGMLLRLQSV